MNDEKKFATIEDFEKESGIEVSDIASVIGGFHEKNGKMPKHILWPAHIEVSGVKISKMYGITKPLVIE